MENKLLHTSRVEAAYLGWSVRDLDLGSMMNFSTRVLYGLIKLNTK